MARRGRPRKAVLGNVKGFETPKLQKGSLMKALRQMFSALSIALGLVWMAVPAAAHIHAWSSLSSGMNNTVGALTALGTPTGSVVALGVLDHGGGPALYTRGGFTVAGWRGD
jgi:hypothetical protein